jgi:hypothetical protein
VSDPAVHGRDWRDEELDLIVADHFAMLEAERAGHPYVKAHHARELAARTGRAHKSVEFKPMNISAVLRELGLPTIRGYRPMENIQRAIFPAIDRFLSARPGAAHARAARARRRGRGAAALGGAPAPPDFTPRPPRPEGLERLVRKFDPWSATSATARSATPARRWWSTRERRRLEQADRPDLARKVRWVSQEDGDGAGYDVHSFDPTGADRLLEVKTTYGGSRTPFFLTRSEKGLSDERPDAFRILRVYTSVASARAIVSGCVGLCAREAVVLETRHGGRVWVSSEPPRRQRPLFDAPGRRISPAVLVSRRRQWPSRAGGDEVGATAHRVAPTRPSTGRSLRSVSSPTAAARRLPSLDERIRACAARVPLGCCWIAAPLSAASSAFWKVLNAPDDRAKQRQRARRARHRSFPQLHADHPPRC